MKHELFYPSVLKSRFAKKLMAFMICLAAYLVFFVCFPHLTFLRIQSGPSHNFSITIWSILSIGLAVFLILFFYFQIVRPIAHLESRLLTLYSSIHGDPSTFPSQISLDTMLDAVIDYQQSFANQELTFKYLRAEAEFNAPQRSTPIFCSIPWNPSEGTLRKMVCRKSPKSPRPSLTCFAAAFKRPVPYAPWRTRSKMCATTCSYRSFAFPVNFSLRSISRMLRGF